MPNKQPSLNGLLMLGATILALFAANSSLGDLYYQFLSYPISITLGSQVLANSLHEWVNELLMVFFFMLVGLEIRVELTDGHLATKAQRLLPFVATIAGVVAPTLVFVVVNHGDSQMLSGWAIPSVTDIAFAMWIMSFFSKSVPPYLKVFLLSLAIFDDLIGIIIIAAFYASSISLSMLGVAFIVLCILLICRVGSVKYLSIYMIFGAVLWYFVLKSGVHATIAGVLVAVCVPRNLVQLLASRLQFSVNYLIIPLFAFVNAGVSLAGFSLESLSHPLSLGIMLGLFVGKQSGVFVSAWFMIRMKLVQLPFEISWLQLYGVSLLTGIGFTVSMFLGNLAFDDSNLAETAKAGVIMGSLLSAICGALVLYLASRSSKITNTIL